ncbi:hypothetical protein FACS1894201_00320 [Bacteroidia bacterium]|nr:hypothetical protein FACS1894201_00320 [Bacteroidia bacterium]
MKEFKDKEDQRPIKLFFQDEARFGRIDNIASCWVPQGCRALVGNQIIRQYTYAYTAACLETGENFSLILPYANSDCMTIFMNEFSSVYSHYRVVMAMDGASWHTGDKVKKWDNIVPMLLTPKHKSIAKLFDENLWKTV